MKKIWIVVMLVAAVVMTMSSCGGKTQQVPFLWCVWRGLGHEYVADSDRPWRLYRA